MKKLFIISIFIMSLAELKAQTQAEMNMEAQREYEQADLDLNVAYKKMLGMLSGNEKTLFIQSERDWIKFRDSQCNFESEQYSGGSMRPMIYVTCLKSLTEERTKQINQLISEREY